MAGNISSRCIDQESYSSGGTSSQRRSCHDCAEFRQLHALGALQQRPAKRRILDHVLEEQLPLGLEGVVVGQVRRHLLPAGIEIDRLLDVRIPDRPRRDAVVLHAAAAQSGHRAALRAVDLQRQEIIAADPHAPRRIELQRRAVLQLEDGIRGIVGRGRVGPALLVGAAVDVDRAQGHQRADLAEQVVDHVAPVAEHVDHDPAAVFLAVVPARPLAGLIEAVENPVAELAADRENAAEEAPRRSGT